MGAKTRQICTVTAAATPPRVTSCWGAGTGAAPLCPGLPRTTHPYHRPPRAPRLPPPSSLCILPPVSAWAPPRDPQGVRGAALPSLATGVATMMTLCMKKLVSSTSPPPRGACPCVRNSPSLRARREGRLCPLPRPPLPRASWARTPSSSPTPYSPCSRSAPTCTPTVVWVVCCAPSVCVAAPPRGPPRWRLCPHTRWMTTPKTPTPTTCTQPPPLPPPRVKGRPARHAALRSATPFPPAFLPSPPPCVTQEALITRAATVFLPCAAALTCYRVARALPSPISLPFLSTRTLLPCSSHYILSFLSFILSSSSSSVPLYFLYRFPSSL